ncbi:hypothetical protein [Bacillus sp. EB600]|uniref:hypothetical protein n=1 Tax=Bacillus sp. EB600 TaxID=2806345 RepID=UPI002108F7C5|nr:hypothetical protein [Bacillus sp. EB600]
MPREDFEHAEMEVEKADLFIVLGSSLSVSPANHFPIIAKQHGAKLVIINLEKTDLDSKANLVINGAKLAGCWKYWMNLFKRESKLTMGKVERKMASIMS